jgi:hypothetical protein
MIEELYKIYYSMNGFLLGKSENIAENNGIM